MDADELRKRAAWLEAGAIRFGEMEVARLLRCYADEARGKADGLEARSARCSGAAAQAGKATGASPGVHGGTRSMIAAKSGSAR